MGFFLHSGKAEIKTLELVGELFRLDPQLMQDGRMEIVNVNYVFFGIVAEFVGIAVRYPAFHSATCHPYGETLDVVVAA